MSSFWTQKVKFSNMFFFPPKKLHESLSLWVSDRSWGFFPESLSPKVPEFLSLWSLVHKSLSPWIDEFMSLWSLNLKSMSQWVIGSTSQCINGSTGQRVNESERWDISKRNVCKWGFLCRPWDAIATHTQIGITCACPSTSTSEGLLASVQDQVCWSHQQCKHTWISL